MLAIPSFLALMVQPSAKENISATMSRTVRSACPGSRDLMNHAFSAKPASVDEKGLVKTVAQFPDPAQILEGDRLPTSRVVGHRHHDHAYLVSVLLQGFLKGHKVHVALEREPGPECFWIPSRAESKA